LLALQTPTRHYLPLEEGGGHICVRHRRLGVVHEYEAIDSDEVEESVRGVGLSKVENMYACEFINECMREARAINDIDVKH
jgi:hypothetical protein